MFNPKNMVLLIATTSIAFLASCKKDVQKNTPEESAGELAFAASPAGGKCRVLTFDAAGSTHKETINRFTRRYDAAGRLTSLHAAIGFPAPMEIYDVDVKYAPQGIFIVKQGRPDTVMHVLLDVKGRVAGYASDVRQSGFYYDKASFVYDSAGRRQTVYRQHTSMPDALTGMAEDTLRYGYDRYGNLLTIAGAFENQYRAQFQYDYNRPVNGGGHYVYYVFGDMVPLVLLEYAGLLGERPHHALASYVVDHYGQPYDYGAFSNHELDAEGRVIAYDNLEWGRQRQSWGCR